MTRFERILDIGDRARFPGKLPPPDQEFIRHEAPQELAAFPQIKYPARLRHPAGFTVQGAVVRTFLKSALVLGALRTFGRKYHAASDFYDRVERDLALNFALSHFRHGDPKGAYCCALCTLATYPLLRVDAIRWFEGRALAPSVRDLISRRHWRFSPSTNPTMIAWSLAESPSA